MYFVITNSDGDTNVTPFTKEALEAAIAENYWGEDVTYLEKIPNPTDTNYWGVSVLIIKGDVVVPKPVETVIKYEI